MVLRRFTPADIEKLRLMASWGHDGKSIARSLDRTPQAIRVKCVELGIKLKRQSVASRRVRLPVPVWTKLKAAAAAYNMTVVKLNALLVETIVRDDLFNAVLDVPPAKTKPVTARVRFVPARTQIQRELAAATVRRGGGDV